MSRLNKSWQAGEGKTALATELHTVLAVSHRQAKGIIDGGCVKVNGELVHGYGQRLMPGDKVEVTYDPDTAYQTLPQPRKQIDKTGFKILWEDKHLLFVDKPAGLLTVPSEKGTEACLAEAITDHYRRRGMKRFQLYVVHRLDRFSSGVLVFAKTPEALHGLKKLFEDHHLNRVYKAILVGEIPENTGTLTGKLVEHAKSLRMAVVHSNKADTKGAKHAITHYRVLERLPGYTVVEVKLETGRRNQIRVQFADRGFPLLGDQVYGETSELIDRQSLHAELLGFRHPITEEAVTVMAPLPADMEKALKALRNQRRVERADAGVKGEEGIFRPKITPGRKFDRVLRAGRYADKTEEGVREDRPTRGPRSEEGDRPRRSDAARPAGRPAGPRTGAPSSGAPRSAAPRAARPERREGDERESRGPVDRPRAPRAAGPRSESKPRTESRPRSESTAKPRAESRPRSESAPRPRGAAPQAASDEARPRRTEGGRAARTEAKARPMSLRDASAPRKVMDSKPRPRPGGTSKPGTPSGPKKFTGKPRRDK